jgi:CBS domain-containing protein
MCLRSDPLHEVMKRLANPGNLLSFFCRMFYDFHLFSCSSLLTCILSGVRRLVIVEAGSKRVEGIISLSDVFNFLLG